MVQEQADLIILSQPNDKLWNVSPEIPLLVVISN